MHDYIHIQRLKPFLSAFITGEPVIDRGREKIFVRTLEPFAGSVVKVTLQRVVSDDWKNDMKGDPTMRLPGKWA